jgi:tripartite ATP-independent transporter DctP family solute receptor
MRRMLGLTALLIFLAATTAYAGVTIKVGHVVDARHPYQIALQGFKATLERETKGQVQVQLYPSSQLGDDRQLTEGMRLGTVEMAAIPTAPLARFLPDFALFDLPFLFDDYNHAYRFLDSPSGQVFLNKMDSMGIHAFAWWEIGFRHIFNSRRPIREASDLKGLKVRIMENPVYADTFRSLGADPTPIAYSEVYTALQQKTVDAAENSLISYYVMRHYEVAPELALAYYAYLPGMLAASKLWFDRLPKNLQTAIEQAAKTCATYERYIFQANENAVLGTLKAEGVKVSTIDRASFEQAVKDVKAKYITRISDGARLLREIESLRGK